MSKQWGHGYAKGSMEGFAEGRALEENANGYFLANEMRVLLCALITAHKQQDELAFWATVEVAKKALSHHANFDEKDWKIFDGRRPLESAA